MTCAGNLLRDHEDIATMLRVLSSSIVRLRQGHYVDPVMLVGIDQFFQRFVAASHFRKEERIVFPHVREVVPDDARLTVAAEALHAAARASLDRFHAVVERLPVAPIETIVDELEAAAQPCLELLRAHLEAERGVLARLHRHDTDAVDDDLVSACAEMERRHLGAAGREWYAQLVADYADIAATWSSWPSTAASPDIASGRPAGGYPPGLPSLM